MVIREDGRRLQQQALRRTNLSEPIPPCIADQITYNFFLERSVLDDFEKWACAMEKKKQQTVTSRVENNTASNRSATSMNESQPYDQLSTHDHETLQVIQPPQMSGRDDHDGVPPSASSFLDSSGGGILIPTVVEHPKPKKVCYTNVIRM